MKKIPPKLQTTFLPQILDKSGQMSSDLILVLGGAKLWFDLIQFVVILQHFFGLSREETTLVFRFHGVMLTFGVAANPQRYFVKLSQPSGVD